MQKKIRFITALILCFAMVFSITACTREEPAPQPSTQPSTQPQIPQYDPENALQLWQRINETMDGLTSMEMTISTQKVYYSAGYKYEQTLESYVLSAKNAHYTQTVSQLKCDALDLQQNINMVEAFCDGKIYRAISDGLFDQKFCSEISHEDYDAFQSGGLTQQLGLADCTTAEFSKGEDGLWRLDFSGYTKKTVDQAMANLGMTESAMGTPVEDMRVSLIANEAFQVVQMETVFEFAPAGESVPVFTVNTVYSGWNTAAFDESKLKAEEYTQVEDVYLLDAIASAIAQRQNASLGQFTLETSYTEDYNGKVSTSAEKGIMIYGLQNNAYRYFFTANTEGKSYIVRYQNGQQTVIYDGQSYTVDVSEAASKAYINGLIDSAQFNALSVTNIEKREDGMYILTADRKDLEGLEMGIDVISAKQKIIISIQDGKLQYIESRMEREATYQNKPLKLYNESTVTFTEISEFPEG